MANYEEWQNLEELTDQKLVRGFRYPDGSMFYIEAPFYTQLLGLKSRYPDEFQKVLDQIEKVCKSNKKVVFCYDFENPFLQLDGFIYREITDITDPIKVYFEDKSRGSDYGDWLAIKNYKW